MRVQLLDLDLLDARADARAVDGDKVRAIAASVGDVGLLNPIRVRPAPGAEGRFEIVAGMHRVAAYRALGLVEIEADVVDSGDLFAELAMIDENLCRAELGPSDRARQVARRKAIYEELHPETRHGSPGVSRQVGDTRERSESDRFTADTAAATGASERTVQREAERGEKISPDVLELVRGTELDTGTFLDRLKRFAPDQQRMLVERELEALDRANPNAHRATMHRRLEPDDSLNYFPTPPWATRALMEVVLPQLGMVPAGRRMGLMWDPACGEGHISGVLAEYAEHGLVAASDIFDYSLDGRSPPGWMWAKDFLANDLGSDPTSGANWIITNPPFGAVTLPFVLKALRLARIGVAMLVRQQWLEGVSRFRELFSQHPPALIGQFVERVPMHKGRWDPDGDTLTSYVWVVWVKAPGATLTNGDTRFFWIPDGQRDALSKPDDVARFTAHPVLGPNEIHQSPSTNDESSSVAGPQAEAAHCQGTGAETLAGREGRHEGQAAQADLPTHSNHPEIPESSTAARMDVLDSTEGGVPAQPLDKAAASTSPAGTQAPPVEAELDIRRATADSAEVGGRAPATVPAAGEVASAPAVAGAPALPLSRADCVPILKARYRHEPAEVLSAETGVPVNTLRTWAYRLGLTGKDRLRESGRAWAKRQNGGAE